MRSPGSRSPELSTDVVAWPFVGRFLRWRHSRTAMQVGLFAVALLVLFDGFFGPQLAPKNLATVGVWLHYRGLVVLALLVAGNLFCMACPFMLSRRLGRWLQERRPIVGSPITRSPLPAVLRNKWLVVGLTFAFFWGYEAFDWWASPWWTAWIVAGYFVVAIIVDMLWRGAAFCKHICPLGHFNMVGSLISPWSITVRDAQICTDCRTKDCIQTLPLKRDVVKGRKRPIGCELGLFQPRKVGNMDCTFCLDCLHACPYDNVGIMARMPTRELWTDPFRSGIGRFRSRADLAIVVLLFVFGGFMNAFGMIRPVYELQARLAELLGTTSPLPGLLIVMIVGIVLLPGLALLGAAWGSRKLAARDDLEIWHVVRRYLFALVPVGFGMWLAHYSFHFLTGALTLVPVAQSFLVDVGWWRGNVAWGMGPLTPIGWLFPIEALMLYLGGFGSILTAFQIASHDQASSGVGDRREILGAALPWMLLTLLLVAVGLWILVQPMEMRGTMMYASTVGG